MKQLAIQDGDLVPGPGGFLTVRGPAKVRQDLGCALREPIGNDRFHPGWGSLLPEYIGRPIDQSTAAMIEAEIYRVVRNYMLTRLAQMQDDQVEGRKVNFDASEIVQNIEGVRIRQSQDRFYVRVTVSTLAREAVTLVTTVEAA